MKSIISKSNAGAKRPPAFPTLTAAQKSWVAARRLELKAAIEAGIQSGKSEGYRALDMDRILNFIDQRQTKKEKTRKSRA